MTEKEFFQHLPWPASDDRSVLAKIAWLQMTGQGARETARSGDRTRKLAKNGLVSRTPIGNRRIALKLTPAGHNKLYAALLQAAVSRDIISSVPQWIEDRYIPRLLANADAMEDRP